VVTQFIDCHAHIVDPEHFSYVDGPGYKPPLAEVGGAESFVATLDSHAVRHALLVQPSCYGTDNAALLDAMAAYPGRFKAIAVVDPESTDRHLVGLADAGVVGVRFNLNYDPDALTRATAERFLARLRELGWFAQVYARDEQWPELVPVLRRSKVKTLIDHFGVRGISQGLDQTGFQTLLAFARESGAVVKLSAPFRISRQRQSYADLAPFVGRVIASFGVERCVWGSDWPFVNLPGGFHYGDALGAVDRWLPAPADRHRVCWTNPIRLFGFESEAT
jgi:predicted TIM-barrel fold metal-dependent hydrolase